MANDFTKVKTSPGAQVFVKAYSSSNAAHSGNHLALYKTTVDVTSAETSDALTINGTVFKKAVATDASAHEFADAAGLVTCINDDTYGLSGVFASAVTTLVTLVSGSAITTASVDENYTVATDNWTELGVKKDVMVKYSCDVTEDGGEDVMGSIGAAAEAKSMEFSGNMRELTPALMNLILPAVTLDDADTPGTDPDIINIGQQDISFFSIAVVDIGSNGQSQIYFAWKCYAMNGTELTLNRGKGITSAFAFKAINDLSQTSTMTVGRIIRLTEAA